MSWEYHTIFLPTKTQDEADSPPHPSNADDNDADNEALDDDTDNNADINTDNNATTQTNNAAADNDAACR
jgi:hypothetical protein